MEIKKISKNSTTHTIRGAMGLCDTPGNPKPPKPAPSCTTTTTTRF